MHTFVIGDAIIILVTPPQYIISFVAFSVTRIPSPKRAAIVAALIFAFMKNELFIYWIIMIYDGIPKSGFGIVLVICIFPFGKTNLFHE